MDRWWSSFDFCEAADRPGAALYWVMLAHQRKRPRDANQLAWQIVQEATGQASPDAPEPPDTRNQAAVALSRLGASKGGIARAAKLSPAKRSAIARNAVKARWAAAASKKR